MQADQRVVALAAGFGDAGDGAGDIGLVGFGDGAGGAFREGVAAEQHRAGLGRLGEAGLDAHLEAVIDAAGLGHLGQRVELFARQEVGGGEAQRVDAGPALHVRARLSGRGGFVKGRADADQRNAALRAFQVARGGGLREVAADAGMDDARPVQRGGGVGQAVIGVVQRVVVRPAQHVEAERLQVADHALGGAGPGAAADGIGEGVSRCQHLEIGEADIGVAHDVGELPQRLAGRQAAGDEAVAGGDETHGGQHGGLQKSARL